MNDLIKKPYTRTLYETYRGKVKWARVKKPNKFGKWSVDLYPDAKSLPLVKKLKEEPAIKNFLKKDDDGEYMTFSRDVNKTMRGKLVMFEEPILLEPDPNNEGKFIPFVDKMIGNGSDCDVQVEIYTFVVPGTGARGRACRLKGMTVWNLVPFEMSQDFTEQEFKNVRGLINEPRPSW